MTSGRLDRLFQASKPLSLERRRIGIVPISEDIRPLGVNGSERGEEVRAPCQLIFACFQNRLDDKHFLHVLNPFLQINVL